MLEKVTRWWHARSRRLDIQLLWPICKENDDNIEQAHRAFMLHALMDDSWRALGSLEAMEAEFERLTRP